MPRSFEEREADAAHAADRQRRMAFDGRYFTGCRNFVGDPTPSCRRRQSTPQCRTCRNCPNCGGNVRIDHHIVHFRSDGVMVQEAKACVQCGAFYFCDHFHPRPAEIEDGRCAVTGCKWTPYEHRLIDAGDGHPLMVCETHFRQYRTWKNHPDKTEEQRPVIILLGKVIENPRYHKRRGEQT